MITIYANNTTDFSAMGMGALLPTSCEITEEAGGMYELTLSHPIDDELRFSLIQPDRIIKAPAPVRETPYAQISGGGSSVAREIYRVYNVTSTLLLRAEPSTDAIILSKFKSGVEVAKLADNGAWYRVAILNGGQEGYMHSQYLQYVRTKTETIVNDNPSGIIQPTQTRNQLFRIVSTEKNMSSRVCTAQHIFYDLKGVIAASTLNFENTPVGTVWQQIVAAADHSHDFMLYCGLSGNITADYSYRNFVDIMLNPDDGLLAQCGGRLVRDNFNVYLIPEESRDVGLVIRRGKNLLSANMVTDMANVVTKIIPTGQKKDGSPLIGAAVSSAHIADYAQVYAKRIQYGVRVSDNMTERQALAQLQTEAQADFDNGIDSPSVSLDADFVRLELAPEYMELANQYALHLYDQVPVIDEKSEIAGVMRMTRYTWNALSERYTQTELGDIVSLTPTVYAYEIGGQISGTKIAAGAVGAAQIADGSITARSIRAGAVTATALDAETVNAQIIAAVNAEIDRISAGEITTADLYAGFGKIIKLAADEIDAGHLTTDALAAKLGEFVKVYADAAGISYADIKDLVTGTAIITTGQANELYIARLAVTEANMVRLSVGQLLISGTDGNLYQLTVDDSGNVSTVLQQVTNQNIADGTIDGGTKILSGSITADQLNVQQIFASSALINAIKAANIDTADLFADNAFIASLNAWNIWSNDYMQLTVRKDELETYLRLTDEGVIIGKTNSDVRMVLTNTDLQIQENGNELATFGASKLTIPRGEFTNALLLGNFAFSPQANGGLTLLVR